MKNVRKMNRKWKDVLRIFLLGICGAVLGINIYLANAVTLGGNQLPMPFGYGAAVVLSGSMEPEFSKGDLIFVKETETYAENDIVVFQTGNILIVHRIIAIDGETITTKGDSNNVADEPIPVSAVRGKVLFRIPFVGKIVGFLKTPIEMIGMIAAAIALIEIPRRKEKKKDDEERKQIIAEIKRLKEEQKD